MIHIKRPLYVLCFIFVHSLFSLSHREMVSALYRCNALTIRYIENPPIGITATTIEHLVRDIYLQNAVPCHSLIQIRDSYFMVYRGIELYPEDEHVFIFSRGYAKTTEPGTNEDFIQRGAAAKAAYIQFEDAIVPKEYPLICFDYDDGRNGFAFGQEKEIQTLQTVYNAVLRKNPEVNIVMVGDCRGAKVALELATLQPTNMRGMILMAPFVSGKDLTDSIATQHLSYLPGHKTVLHTFFKLYFTTYKEELDTLSKRLNLIDPNLPIFIGHRRYDELISDDAIQFLLTGLSNTGNQNVEFVVTEDRNEPHSKLTGIREIQLGIAEFIQKYRLLEPSGN